MINRHGSKPLKPCDVADDASASALIAGQVFGIADDKHPAVAAFMAQGQWLGSGRIEAHEIFRGCVPAEALEIRIFEADHTAYSVKLKQVVMMRDVPDHTAADFVLLSGTRVRDLLVTGEALAEECARPEVAQIQMQHYQQAAE